MAQQFNPHNYKLTPVQERVLDQVVANDGCWTSYFAQPEEQAAVATLVALGILEYELEMGEDPGTVQAATENGAFYLLPVMP